MKNLGFLLYTAFISSSLAFCFIPKITVTTRHPHTCIYSIFDDDETESQVNGDAMNFEKFNPLSYKASKGTSAYVGTQISLRKTRMQELTNELLNAATNKTEMDEILLGYKDFLIEPLEDPEAVLVCLTQYFVCMVGIVLTTSYYNFLFNPFVTGSRLNLHTDNVKE